MRFIAQARGRIFGDVVVGAVSAICASFIFQMYLKDQTYDTEMNKFANSLRIIAGYCRRFSTWYGPDEQSMDAFQIHRMPGVPDPLIDISIESLSVIAQRDEDAYLAMLRLSEIYKNDLRNYILNEDTVRQWRAHTYYQALDYICAWAGVKSNILCAGSSSIALVETGPRMVYYFGSGGGKVVPCDSQEIYDTYVFPSFD